MEATFFLMPSGGCKATLTLDLMCGRPPPSFRGGPTPRYLNHHSQPRPKLRVRPSTFTKNLDHHSRIPLPAPHYLNHHSRHTTSTITYIISTIIHSTIPQPSLTAAPPHYLNHHSQSILPQPSFTAKPPHYLNHHSHPQYLNHHSHPQYLNHHSPPRYLNHHLQTHLHTT